MRIKTNVKAGGIQLQHNQTIRSVKVKSGVKAGKITTNHSQQISRSLKVRSGVKAGKVRFQDIPIVVRG